MTKKELLNEIPLYWSQPNKFGQPYSQTHKEYITLAVNEILEPLQDDDEIKSLDKLIVQWTGRNHRKISTTRSLLDCSLGVFKFFGITSSNAEAIVKKYRRPVQNYSQKAIDNDLLGRVFTSLSTRSVRGDKVHAEFIHRRDVLLAAIMLLTGGRLDQILSLKETDVYETPTAVVVEFTRQKNQAVRVQKFIPKSVLLPHGVLFYDCYIQYIHYPYRVGELLFYSEPGVKISRFAINALYDQYGIHPHMFRHTAATRVAQRTGSVVAVATLLDHSSLAISQKYVQLINHTEKIIGDAWSTEADTQVRASYRSAQNEVETRSTSQESFVGQTAAPL